MERWNASEKIPGISEKFLVRAKFQTHVHRRNMALTTEVKETILYGICEKVNVLEGRCVLKHNKIA